MMLLLQGVVMGDDGWLSLDELTVATEQIRTFADIGFNQRMECICDSLWIIGDVLAVGLPRDGA